MESTMLSRACQGRIPLERLPGRRLAGLQVEGSAPQLSASARPLSGRPGPAPTMLPSSTTTRPRLITVRQ